MQTSARHIYNVSELNTSAKLALEQGFGLIWLEAEISNLAKPASGHWYFSLKDKKAQIRCAFFKGRNRLLNFDVKNGQLLLVRGRISLYEARGDYQLIIDHMEPAGQGDLQKSYEQLKEKLNAAGYFDEEHKLPLPNMPTQIGLITSASGAAIRDVLHVLQRRFPMVPVIVYPTPVQGETAAENIMAAIRLAEQRQECDILLLIRGGGSIEDLWAFNNEQLAKTIYECAIPIVSGIGHEIDFTIADFVADSRAPTPSAAAEIIVPDQLELTATIQQQIKRLTKQINKTMNDHHQKIDWYDKQLQQFHPGKQLLIQQHRVTDLQKYLTQAMRIKLQRENETTVQLKKRILSQAPDKQIKQYKDQIQTIKSRLLDKINNSIKLSRYRLENSTHALNTVSPIATLSRGYSISQFKGSDVPIKQSSELQTGELIETRLAKGRITSRVESIDE